MGTKICCTCRIEKSLADFHKKLGQHRHGVNGSCKKCVLEKQQKYRDNNREHVKQRKINNRKNRLATIAQYKDVPCADCKKKYPYYVMDFDHLDKTQKVANISTMVNSSIAVERIIEEIKKCEVVCSNCHRIRTFKEKHDGVQMRKKLSNKYRNKMKRQRDRNLDRALSVRN